MEADPVCSVDAAAARSVSTATASETGGQSMPPDAAPASTRQLILAAVLRGLFLDEPWRHTVLRNRLIWR